MDLEEQKDEYREEEAELAIRLEGAMLERTQALTYEAEAALAQQRAAMHREFEGQQARNLEQLDAARNAFGLELTDAEANLDQRVRHQVQALADIQLNELSEAHAHNIDRRADAQRLDA